MVRWLRLTYRVPESMEDEVAVCLHEEGSVGVEIRSGLALAYFPEKSDPGSVDRRVRAALEGLPGAGGLRLEGAESVEDGDWHERWVAGLKPIPAGESFLIVPGPVAPPGGGARRIVRLTPGRAFGTGEHATTRLCLSLIEGSLAAGESFLDVGTGSGILSIAALLLGAGRTLALDPDPQAVAVARRNAELNAVPRLSLLIGTLGALRATPFDVVAANVNAPTLLRSMRDLAGMTGRDLILSGILQEESDEVIEAAKLLGLAPQARLEEGDWIAMKLRRGGARPR